MFENFFFFIFVVMLMVFEWCVGMVVKEMVGMWIMVIFYG